MDYFKTIMETEVQELKQKGVVDDLPVVIKETKQDQNTYAGRVSLIHVGEHKERKYLYIEIPFETSYGFRSEVDKLLTVYHELGHLYYDHLKKDVRDHMEEIEADLFSGQMLLKNHSLDESEKDRASEVLNRRLRIHIFEAVDKQEICPTELPFEIFEQYVDMEEDFLSFLYYDNDRQWSPILKRMKQSTMRIELKRKKGKKVTIFEQALYVVHNKIINFVLGVNEQKNNEPELA